MNRSQLKAVAYSLELLALKQNREFISYATYEVISQTSFMETQFNQIKDKITFLWEQEKFNINPRRGEIANLFSCVRMAEYTDFSQEQINELRDRVESLISNSLSAGRHDFLTK